MQSSSRPHQIHGHPAHARVWLQWHRHHTARGVQVLSLVKLACMSKWEGRLRSLLEEQIMRNGRLCPWCRTKPQMSPAPKTVRLQSCMQLHAKRDNIDVYHRAQHSQLHFMHRPSGACSMFHVLMTSLERPVLHQGNAPCMHLLIRHAA